MKKNQMNSRRRKEALIGYSYMSPSFLILLLFIIIPIVISVVLSFMKYNGFSGAEWIGTANYEKLFHDKTFGTSLVNTFVYVLISVPGQVILSLVFAAILAEKFRDGYGEFIRGTLFIPVLCSTSLVGYLFYYLFASDKEAFVNMVLTMLGMEPHAWLAQRSTALLIICLVTIWKNVGYYLVIIYAAIMDVPVSLYEAAMVDGASPMDKFLHITLPSIKPILYTVITLCTIWSFQVFDLTYVMTKGGPGNATISPVLYLYDQAFSGHKLGYASAVACVLALVIFVLTIALRAVFGEKAGDEDA